MANNVEDFIKETEKTGRYLTDMFEIPFGSNKSLLVHEDGTAEWNTYNLEIFTFKNIRDFAEWYWDEKEGIEYIYEENTNPDREDGEEETWSDKVTKLT